MEQTFFAIGLIYSMLWAIGLSINVRSYKYYRRVYRSLPSMTFYQLGNNIVTDENIFSKDRGTGFNWFLDDGTIGLTKRHYIHGDWFFIITDPYYAYWYFKFNKWLNRYAKINEMSTK